MVPLGSGVPKGVQPFRVGARLMHPNCSKQESPELSKKAWPCRCNSTCIPRTATRPTLELVQQLDPAQRARRQAVPCGAAEPVASLAYIAKAPPIHRLHFSRFELASGPEAGSSALAAAAAAAAVAATAMAQQGVLVPARRCSPTYPQSLWYMPALLQSHPTTSQGPPTLNPARARSPLAPMLTSSLAPFGVAALQRLGPLLPVAAQAVAARVAQCRGASTMPHAAAAARKEAESWYTGARVADAGRRPKRRRRRRRSTNVGCKRSALGPSTPCHAVRMEERLESPATRHGEVRLLLSAAHASFRRNSTADCRAMACNAAAALPLVSPARISWCDFHYSNVRLRWMPGNFAGRHL